VAFPWNDIREFVEHLDQTGQLKRIGARVDPELEITEITDRCVKSGGPALLFENVAGSHWPVLINVFGTEHRMKLALGVEDFRRIAERIGQLLKPQAPGDWWGKLKKVPQLIELARITPQRVSSAACQQVVETDAPSLGRLPILKCWPADAGRYVTLGLVVTKHPETQVRNVGIYRLQVYDDRHAGMHIHPFHDGAENLRAWQARGEKMPVAVAIGADPVTTYAASAPTPPSFDELLFAGFLRGKPVKTVACKTVDLDVPADCEIILEGYVDPRQMRLEGPFGDHTGYYSPAEDFPVFELTAVTHRRDPIYQAMVVGYPPMEDTFLGKATERIFLPVIRTMIPEIVDYNLPVFGVFHNWLVVSIRKSYPYQARKVMHAIWGLGQLMLSKFIVVVDEHIDVHDLQRVMFELAANVDPRRDTIIVDGPLDILDHASVRCGVGSKMGIDATAKLPDEGHPRPWPARIAMDPDIAAKVSRRWNEYGF